MRIVLDTNILISALLSPSGPPRQLLEIWEAGEMELITSVQQRDEVARVLDYEHLRPRITAEQAEQLVSLLEHTATMVEPVPNFELSVDPADNVILATAVAGQADMIVTGDKRHLLTLVDAQGIPIVTASAAVARLAK